MKANKLPIVRTNYQFEAPVFEAARPNSVSGQSDASNKLLDLNAFLAPFPENVFLVRVSGESMIDANIFDGDILVVDSKEAPKRGKIVIASLNGEMAVKFFDIIDGETYLISANKKFLPMKISELFEFRIQGVVKHVVRSM